MNFRVHLSSSVEPIQIVISSHEEESDGQSDPTEEYTVSRTTVSNPEEESELQSEPVGESTVFSPAAVESGKTPDTVSIPHEESGQTIELTVSSPQAKTGEQVEQIKRKDATKKASPLCDFVTLDHQIKEARSYICYRNMKLKYVLNITVKPVKKPSQMIASCM